MDGRKQTIVVDHVYRHSHVHVTVQGIGFFLSVALQLLFHSFFLLS